MEEVHRVRTGTRRLESHLESFLEQKRPESKKLIASASSWMRQMKKIRRAAGDVRDLDVHRKLLEEFAGVGKSGEKLHSAGEQGELEREVTSPEEKQLVERQAVQFDAWLQKRRSRREERLRKQIAKRLERIEEQEGRFFTLFPEAPLKEKQATVPEALALASFRKLVEKMPQLNAGNLHDFRKVAKKARYLTESEDPSPRAKTVGKKIKELQDSIGFWHDWLLLAQEAQSALDDPEAELVRHLEARVASSYEEALATTEKIRVELLANETAKKRSPAKKKPIRRKIER